jgi:hypothetical protein
MFTRQARHPFDAIFVAQIEFDHDTNLQSLAICTRRSLMALRNIDL